MMEFIKLTSVEDSEYWINADNIVALSVIKGKKNEPDYTLVETPGSDCCVKETPEVIIKLTLKNTAETYQHISHNRPADIDGAKIQEMLDKASKR